MDALKKQEGGSHYKEMAIQPIEFITANNIPFMEGNCIQYLCRHRSKNGAEDIKKVIHYCELMLQLYYEEPVKGIIKEHAPLSEYTKAVKNTFAIGWNDKDYQAAVEGVFIGMDEEGRYMIVKDGGHTCIHLNRAIFFESEEQFERLKKYGIK